MPLRPLPASLPDAFSVRDARRVGVSPRRLRGSDLDAPFHGTRLRPRCADPPHAEDESPAAAEDRRLRGELLRQARAYETVASPHAFLWGPSAAAAWTLPLPLRALRSVDEPGRVRTLDVAVTAPHRAPRAAGVVGRQFAPGLVSVTTHDGLRVTTPATTWAQLAPLLTVDELIVLGDAIVAIPRVRGMTRGAPGSGLATIAQLDAALNVGRRRGAAKLREALPQIRVGSASPPETLLRLALVRSGLPEPALDYDVLTPDGRAIGYTELAYPGYGILIEYEGDHHRVDRAQWNRDIEKHAACVALGWEVLRLTSAHMYPRTDAAVRRIHDALTRAGWRP
ncbi:hypothetical protein [Microbacterium sp.]|uniref:hypothetical protein n=1 Tax=Microbacterium sp. TaxID=51671 RepID=UPI0039E34ECA